ncbi:MAG: CaiB/BaiF CoA-transferase family protein, partial [Dehalococcoidia bacterium]
MAMALEGIKVIDLSRYAPGFYVSMYLGDMGADVIRVEEPAVSGRRAGFQEAPLAYKDMEDQRGAAYNALERNKRKIALNLKDPEARDVFYKLVAGADVVLEGSRPGVAQRLAVDYETCRGINPRIVYCSLTGFGQDGPYAQRAGHDINYIAIAGALGLVGQRDGTLAIPANLLADYAGGAQFAIIGVLTALLARQRTGKGQFVDISMTDGVVSLMVQFTQQYFTDGEVPGPASMRLNGGVPHYNVYQAKDSRWIAVGANEPYFFANVCKLIGRPDLAERQHDPDRRDEIEAAFREAFKTRTAQEWHDLMSAEDTCVTRVYDLDEVFADPQIVHRQMALELEHEEVGAVRQVGFPVKLSETPASVRRFAGPKGRDTDDVMTDLGYSPEQVRRLR